MARLGLSWGRKFKRLARTLDDVQVGFGEILARGVLELLWESAYEATDDYLGDATDVEALAHWRGRAGVLVEALERAGGQGRAGFIDEGGTNVWPDGKPGTYRVHDLWDHCPDFIHKRVSREVERKRRGRTLSELRSEAGRKGAAVTNSKRTANARQVTGNRTAFAEESAASDRHTDGKLPSLTHPIPSHPIPSSSSNVAEDPNDDPDNPQGLSVCRLPAGEKPVESNLPVAPPAPPPASANTRAGTIEAPTVSSPAPPPNEEIASFVSLALPSPEEVRATTWPLTDRFAQQLAEMRGLTACPLSLPKRENRDRFEYLLSQTTVVLAVQICWPEWQNASSRGERVTSLGFFLRVLEQVARAPPPAEPAVLSTCEPWNSLLEEASTNGGRELVQRWLSRLSPSIEGKELLLTAPDEYVAAFVADLHLSRIQEAAQARFGLHVRLVCLEGPAPSVGGAP